MKKITIIIVLFTAPALFSMNYLNHLKKVNKVICDAMFTSGCKRPPNGPADKAQCKTSLDAVSKMNKRNAKIKVTKKWSNACIAYLKKFPAKQCKNVAAKSVTGPCSRK